MAYQDILYDKRDGIATITINRPAVLNAFRAETVEEMLGAMRDAEDERDEGRADRLAQQARRALDRTGAAAAMPGRARDDGAIVGRLEQAEAGAAQCNPPDDVGRRRVRRQQRQ